MTRRRDRVVQLVDAMGTGEILTIVYDGGTQPGAKRDVTVIDVLDDGTSRAKVRALCLASGRPKTFFIEKLTIVPPDHPAPAYRIEPTPRRDDHKEAWRSSPPLPTQVTTVWGWLWRGIVGLLAIFGLLQLFGGSVGAAEQKRSKEALANPQAQVRAGVRGDELLIGAWLNRAHPCGLIAITSDGQKLRHFSICEDGSSSRDVPAIGVSDRLEGVKPPRGAKRAWQTPGLRKREVTVLGFRTVEFRGPDGDRYDFHRYVEKADGNLLVYQQGVGIEPGQDGFVFEAEPLRFD